MTVVVTGSPSTAAEGLVLDGLNLNDATNFQLLEPCEFPPPRKRQEWVQGADADGAGLVRDPLYENRTITPRWRIPPQASMDSALALIAALELKLEEAEKNEGGIPLVWTPSTSAHSGTFYVLSGEFVEGPTVDKRNWERWKPIISVRFDCRPFMYGAEVLNAATVTNANRFQLLTLAAVPGDVPAEGRVVITDAASQSRRHAEIALQQRYYDAATSLSVDTFVISGFGGASTTRAGSFNTNVMRGTLTTTAVAICGTGNLGHVGTFRVKARVYPVIGTTTPTDLKLRLSWKEGDGPLRSNDWATCPAGTAAWSEVDLGLISIPEKKLGTQRWTGQIEAYSTATGDTLDVDYLILEPTEVYGKGRAPVRFETPTAFSARDEFDQTAGSLSGKTLPVGGTWSGAGDADDFTLDTTGHTAQRVAVTDADEWTGRYGIAGTTTFTNTIVQADMQVASSSLNNLTKRIGVVARYTDTNNWLIANAYRLGDGAPTVLAVHMRVAGVVTQLVATTPFTTALSTWYTLRLVVNAGGNVFCYFFPQGGVAGTPLVASNAALATSGALASGKCGIYDANVSSLAYTRSFDNFWAAVFSPDAVIFSGQSAEIRHDSAIREDSTGTYWGPIDTYRGARVLIPEAGDEGRTSRLLGKARRSDIDVAADDQIADSTTLTVHLTPRYVVVPR